MRKETGGAWAIYRETSSPGPVYWHVRKDLGEFPGPDVPQ